MHTPRHRALAVLLALGALGAARCQPGPPDAALVDPRGEVDRDAFAALVAAAEETRGLGFIRRPELVLVDANASELAPLREEAALLAPIRGDPGQVASPKAGAWPDRAHGRIVAVRPPNGAAIRKALARLLDAQQYPRVADIAPLLTGDAGVTVRALLEASARATASGRWFQGGYRGEEIDLLAGLAERIAKPDALPPLTHLDPAEMAPLLLLQLDDPHLAFRRPPLSTKQLLSPAAFLASERPLRLDGAPPVMARCAVAEDESVGVLRLLDEVARIGVQSGDETIAAWKGDRLVRFSCPDGRAPWVYVIALAREADASGFARRAGDVLPPTLARPASVAVLDRRVTVWNGLGDEQALAFGRELALHEIADLDAFLR
jgi:hypothetical protein